MSDNVIRFPGEEPPTASEDVYLESLALHADCLNACRGILGQLKIEDRRIIVAGLMGSVLCEYGKTPSRSLAIAMLGPTFEAILEYIDHTYGERPGRA